MGIWFLWTEVGKHLDVCGSLVCRYVASMNYKHSVRSLDVPVSLHQSSKFSAGGLTPSGSVLAFHASGEEVGYPGLRAGCRVHECVGELLREEVGIVRVRVP